MSCGSYDVICHMSYVSCRRCQALNWRFAKVFLVPLNWRKCYTTAPRYEEISGSCILIQCTSAQSVFVVFHYVANVFSSKVEVLKFNVYFNVNVTWIPGADLHD